MSVETIDALKRKLKGAKDLHSVVRTMKSLAAVSIRQYEEAARSLEEYYRTVELGLRAALLRRTLGGTTEPQGSVILVFGSDQGMVGQFNDALVDFVFDSLGTEGPSPARCRFWVAGVKAAGSVEDRAGAWEDLFPLPPSARAITGSVQDLILRFEHLRREQGEQRLVLFHNVPASGAFYRQHRADLLPPDERWLGEIGTRHWPRRGSPVYRVGWEELFSGLIGEYLFVALYRAFAASMAAENAARLAAMQRAEKNIEEMKDDLIARYHSRRQSAITQELFDVISGFEALVGREV